MEKPVPKRGRPPLPADQVLQPKNIRLTAKQWEKVEKYGLDWLRQQIDEAPLPKRAKPSK